MLTSAIDYMGDLIHFYPFEILDKKVNYLGNKLVRHEKTIAYFGWNREQLSWGLSDCSV
jgi:hypothetical protein